MIIAIVILAVLGSIWGARPVKVGAAILGTLSALFLGIGVLELFALSNEYNMSVNEVVAVTGTGTDLAVGVISTTIYAMVAAVAWDRLRTRSERREAQARYARTISDA